MKHPACFTPEQYADWLESAKSARYCESPCDDCTDQHKIKMMGEKRCYEMVVRVRFMFHPGKKYKE